MVRLQKAIADSGFCSRRKAEEYIVKGKVFVNGERITELGSKVEGNEEIIVDGNAISKQDKEYYILYKPRGVISSTKDDKGRKTVVDFFSSNKRLYPVGRLDYDTTGIILLTNDGEFANMMLHPKNKIPKVYIAKLEGIIDGYSIKKIKSGVVIDGIKCTPDRVKLKSADKKSNTCIVEITIHDGRNHEVKRIFESAGYNVIKLKRESIAFLTLQGLSSGEFRKLTIKEVKQLYAYTNDIKRK
ncbi:pseudouridine synthase [Clostridium sp. CAG:433]|jgi:23S rRNA pseudouridine2605 synthase|nr:pseudouridine synthase [Clostridium sp. CAG:433]